jgi:Protein of unknown function (DUF3050)
MEQTSPSSRDETTTGRLEARLHARLQPLREALLQHEIYARVTDLPSLQVFMTSHVFAVWDFMSLLKTLQCALTCVEVPWVPPRDIYAARLINCIVLGEETDEVAPGEYASHFDLYLQAMDELGTDRAPIDSLVRAIRAGQAVDDALDEVAIPASTCGFVRATMHGARGAVHEVAASFLHGREDLVPMMFRRIRAGLVAEPTLRCASFCRYLERHIDVDEQDHGPMARQLLRSLCAADATRWEQAAEAAAVSLTARIELWDGVLEQIQSSAVHRDTLAPPWSTDRMKVRAVAGDVDTLTVRARAGAGPENSTTAR